MSLLQIYWRALGYLAADRKRVAFICGANVTLAIIAILEPIMFGRVIDAISDGGSVFSTLAVWAGIGVFNVVAFVLVARGADRFAHARRSEVLCQSFERVITMPLAWHHQRGTSNSLHTLLRAVETLFSLWLEFMRQHLSTVVALVLLVPTALSMDIRMSMVLLALGALYVGIGRLVMRRTRAGQASVERHFHQVFAHVSDSVSNVAVLQSYNRIGHETDALKRYVKNLLDAQYPVLDWWALANALHRLSSTISMMVVLLIGSYLVMHGQLRIGDVIAFTGFATLLIARLDQMSAFANQISEARAKLINLLQRVFAPSSGRILIDGIDTRTVTRKSLRHSIATVFQDAGLLNRSIEDNIRVGRAEATYDEVHAAANAAAAQDFI
ncbi:MAG: ATP-binding cassette domain-containing protein, partial [Mesorhizobium sp.]